jgi:hypothetical protein
MEATLFACSRRKVKGGYAGAQTELLILLEGSKCDYICPNSLRL